MTTTRAPSAKDFTADVEGIGRFTFGYRTLSDEIAIGVEFSLITQGIDTPTRFLRQVASWISTLRVLTVSSPAGWNIDEMDPLDDETYEKLSLVFSVLRTKEASFRKKPNPPIQGDGAGAGEQT